MKDPTSEILTAFEAALTGQLTYSGTTFGIRQNMPRTKDYKYVLLEKLTMTEDMTADTFIVNCVLDIMIVAGGYVQKGNYSAVNSISNSLMQILTKKSLSMTNFTMGVTPFPTNILTIEEYMNNDIIVKKIITYEFTVCQN